MGQVKITLDDTTHTDLKVLAAQIHQTIQALAVLAIQEYLATAKAKKKQT
jgi:predicted transcriptional regulator